MKISKKNIELKDALNKEWVLSNGIGGFCSTTVVGANTRRYHGLLVAPLMPPAQRHLIFSKLDESIEIEGENGKCITFTCNGEQYKFNFILKISLKQNINISLILLLHKMILNISFLILIQKLKILTQIVKK